MIDGIDQIRKLGSDDRKFTCSNDLVLLNRALEISPNLGIPITQSASQPIN